jgi:glycosyltransferase involved in cell wall biosynthesis
MRTLLNNPELRAAMGNAAFEHATAAFNVDRMAEGYASLYRKALNTSSLETSTAAAA